MDGFTVQTIEAGESPMTGAEGYLNTDLNARFIRNRAATYLFPACSDGIEGIHKRDILVVDRSLSAKPGRVIVANIEGEYQLRRIEKQGSRIALVTDIVEDPAF